MTVRSSSQATRPRLPAIAVGSGAVDLYTLSTADASNPEGLSLGLGLLSNGSVQSCFCRISTISRVSLYLRTLHLAAVAASVHLGSLRAPSSVSCCLDFDAAACMLTCTWIIARGGGPRLLTAHLPALPLILHPSQWLSFPGPSLSTAAASASA